MQAFGFLQANRVILVLSQGCVWGKPRSSQGTLSVLMSSTSFLGHGVKLKSSEEECCWGDHFATKYIFTSGTDPGQSFFAWPLAFITCFVKTGWTDSW